MQVPFDTLSRCALINRTNVIDQDDLESSLSCSDRKRPLDKEKDDRDKKRLKLTPRPNNGDHTSGDGDTEDDDFDETLAMCSRSRKRTVFGMRETMMSMWSLRPSCPAFPMNSLLRTFVSSHKADMFKCHSMDPNSFMAVPYACSYSHAAKRGEKPLLAVATEQGAVHILNTTKRSDWDCEPQRDAFVPHENGIFDIKWSLSDKYLATASGDLSTRISSADCGTSSRNRVLHTLNYHGGTVKSIAWDPSGSDTVLCTGGRDGSICLWDLRVGESRAQEPTSGESKAIVPVTVICAAHDLEGKARPRCYKGRVTRAAAARTITGILYPENDPYSLVSAGSYDGILHRWDLRLPKPTKRTKFPRGISQPVEMSPNDPTTSNNTRRPRGITSLVAGHGPSAGLIFAHAADSRVHTYTLPSLDPLSGQTEGTTSEDPFAHTHPDMQHSFYVRLALSPCGQWLASGCAGDGRAFLFDVSNTASMRRARMGNRSDAVSLCGQTGEIGGIDWAQGMLATCADDTTVRIWRPDVDVHRRCMSDSEEMKWEWSWASGD